MEWFTTTVLGQVLLLLAVLVFIKLISKPLITLLINRIASSHVHEAMQARQKRVDTLVNISGAVVMIFLAAVGIFGLLSIFKVNIAGLLAGAGVVGIIVGIGGQSAIKDYMAGIFILMENQFRLGDIITIEDKSGVVERITLRITKLRDLDGNLHIIPNGEITSVTNRSFGWSNVHINVGVSYDSDIDKVKKVVNKTGESLRHDKEFGQYIMEPIAFMRVDSFDDSSIQVKIIGKVLPGTQWDVAGEFRKRLKANFDKEGIEIPFPQRTIHQPTKKK